MQIPYDQVITQYLIIKELNSSQGISDLPRGLDRPEGLGRGRQACVPRHRRQPPHLHRRVVHREHCLALLELTICSCQSCCMRQGNRLKTSRLFVLHCIMWLYNVFRGRLFHQIEFKYPEPDILQLTPPSPVTFHSLRGSSDWRDDRCMGQLDYTHKFIISSTCQLKRTASVQLTISFNNKSFCQQNHVQEGRLHSEHPRRCSA